MAETLRIEIPIETVDNTDPGVSNATKKFEKMERAANSANSSAKKASAQFPSLTSKLRKPKRAWQAGRKKSTKSCLKRRNESVRYSLRWVMG